MASQAHRLLMLGGGEGWHAEQLRQACTQLGVGFDMAPYESLRHQITPTGNETLCASGQIFPDTVVLCRTMPAGTLEQITFRLATLHHLVRQRIAVINSPSSLEIAIDKYASLAMIASLGVPVPETIVTQSSGEALDAFERLGGDCIVKPIFGGEGRGVMRVSDPELARTSLRTLEQLGAILYLQQFVTPGGADTRILRIGDHYHAFRRTNANDFRTNVTHGGRCEKIELSAWHQELATKVTDAIGLEIGSVDLIDDDSDGGSGYRIVEVNGIPGWKSAQSVTRESIAMQIVTQAMNRRQAGSHPCDQGDSAENSAVVAR